MNGFHLSTRTRTWLWWIAVLAILWGAWQQFGGKGLALALSMLSFWLLLQFTRVMNLLKVVASRPKGHAPDALRLHRQLREGMRLIDVVRLAMSLGEPQSPAGQQPEVFTWGDEQGNLLTCEFVDGRLTRRELHQPEEHAPSETPSQATSKAPAET